MRITEAFREYGVELETPQWSSSAVSDNPRQVVVSLWRHNFNADMSRYKSRTVHWKGAGKPTFYRHLQMAMAENLPIRVVLASTADLAEVEKGNATRTQNDFEPDFSLIGKVVRLDPNELELTFERTGTAPISKYAKTGVKYWHVAEAVEAMGTPCSTAEVRNWLARHYPGETHSDIRDNLAHLTVNDVNRRHHDKSRKIWRSDSGHPRDRLFRTGTGRQTRYEVFRPSVHGHWDLREGTDGKWEAYRLPLSELERAQAQAQEEAFAQEPPITSDHDARVWALTAVALRQGQAAFRAQILEAYGHQCAITGCKAIAVLEAAHIVPYRGEHTHRLDNGLPLRADIHTLFDLGLLWITDELKVALADSLAGTEYADLAGQALRAPKRAEDRPNPAHLEAHRQLALQKQAKGA